jgi:trimethylamine--corrinoid protein Co-methyltransferase
LPHPEAQKLLSDAGADIGSDQVVRIPERLIEQAIASLPKRDAVTLYGRDP